MKKILKTTLAAVLALSMLASCSFLPFSVENEAGTDGDESKPASVTSERTFAVGDYGVNVSVKDDWIKTDATNFDLQLSSKKYSANLSIFVFYKVDMATGYMVEDMYNEQNTQLFENRQNVTVVSELETKTVGTKTVYAKTTSAENNGSKNYYRTYMLDDSESKVLVWVMINSVPSDMEKYADYFDGIVDTISFKQSI